MAIETIYFVQAFSLGKGKGLKADPAVRCRSAEAARRMAEKLAPTKAGVVAFAATADAELGDYDEPTILYKIGQLPASFDDG